MFEIEFVAVRDAGEPPVVEKVTSNFVRLSMRIKLRNPYLKRCGTSSG